MESRERFFKIFFVVLILLSMTACAHKNYHHRSAPQSGWVNVSFGLNAKFMTKNVGRLDEVYDEFVGGLIDDGLDINKAHWIKPTYGNQNIIWTANSELGSKKRELLIRSKSDFSSNAYSFFEGEIATKTASWFYSGYVHHADKEKQSSFKSFVFSCKSGKKASVFYWGENNIPKIEDNPAIIRVLEKMAVDC